MKLNEFKIAVFIWPLICIACLGQTPILESGSDCADWFVVSWESLERCHAVVGFAESANSSGDGHVEIDWFEIKCLDKNTKSNLHYCESRIRYSDGPDDGLDGVWIKTLSGFKNPMWSAGDFSSPLERREPAVFNEKGRLISGSARTDFPPKAYTMAVMTGAGFRMCNKYNVHYFAKIFEESKKLEQQDDPKGYKAVFIYDNEKSREFIADPNHGMPLITRGYFRDKSKKGVPDRSFFRTMNFESKTTWECLDENKGVYAPTTVDNFVHRGHPLHKTSMHVQVVTAYSIENIEKELLTDENMGLYLQNMGPTADLRAKLAEKVRKRRSELSK